MTAGLADKRLLLWQVAEYHGQRLLLSPDLHPPPHRAQQVVRVFPRMRSLQFFQQFTAAAPRLRLKPGVQLPGDRLPAGPAGADPVSVSQPAWPWAGLRPPTTPSATRQETAPAAAGPRCRGSTTGWSAMSTMSRCWTRIRLSSRIGSSVADKSATLFRTACGVLGSVSSLWCGAAGGWQRLLTRAPSRRFSASLNEG